MTKDCAAIPMTAPDISRWQQGNTGIPYVITRDSGKPGLHALILGITHGNEICGAVTVDALLAQDIWPKRGKLTLGFANVAAYQRFSALDPNNARAVDEDLNRLWDVAALESNRQSVELDRARALRPLIDRVDRLLDLHSMQYSAEPLLLTGTATKTLALARAMGLPAYLVQDAGHAAGRRLRDYGGFNDPADPRIALLAECGQHYAADSVEFAWHCALRFLAVLDMIDPEKIEPGFAPHAKPQAVPQQRVISVTDVITINTDRFRFVRSFGGMEVIAEAGTLLGMDGQDAIRTPYPDCILIMPSRRHIRGQTAVRLGRFIG